MVRKLSAHALAWTLALVACDRAPVVWDAIGGSDSGQFVAPVSRGVPPAEPGMCHASIQFAGGPTVLWAAWWTTRPDSGVVLRIARSDDDGAHWATPLTAESRDHGVRGCTRPPPAIAYDADSSIVHLAYFLEPTDGAGVYYAHYMASMFHAPVPIVFGEQPVAVAVAASHDTVAVAYEDPNRRVSQVAIALSTTTGHLFTIRVPVSGEDVAAHHPAVAIVGHRLAVGWRETPARDDDTAEAGHVVGRPVGRTGRIE